MDPIIVDDEYVDRALGVESDVGFTHKVNPFGPPVDVVTAPVFNTHYKRRRQGGAINSGELITEAAGYIPADKQILGMIAAGIRLEEYRKEAYDWTDQDDITDDAMDDMDVRVRSPGFDPADATQVQLSLREQARRADKARRKAEARAKAEQSARDKAPAVPPSGAAPSDATST